MPEFSRTSPYGIGSDELPGLSKLTEEMGETQTIIGKIIGLGHMGQHWDGQFLKEELEDEIADVLAACEFVQIMNELNDLRINERTRRKLDRFVHWHNNIQAGRDPNFGVKYSENERVPVTPQRTS